MDILRPPIRPMKSFTRLGQTFIILFSLSIVFVAETHAIDPGKQFVTFGISYGGPRGLLNLDLGYEYSVNQYFAPQIEVNMGIWGMGTSITGTLNFYDSILHVAIPMS